MNIRVLREAGGLGDIVRILPAIRGLREKYPTARIDVFLPGAYAPLVRRAGDADNIIETSFATRRSRLAEPDEERWPYARAGRLARPHRAVLHGCGRPAARDAPPHTDS